MKAVTGRADNEGFTLIEALVALSVFAFSLVGLAYLMNSAVQTDVQTRRMTAATTLAQQKLEQLCNTPYANVNETGSPQSLNEEGETAGAAFYERSWTVSPVTGMKKVTVTVAWTDRWGSHQVELQTILTP
jgi:type IV pilus assembly protein PilV